MRIVALAETISNRCQYPARRTHATRPIDAMTEGNDKMPSAIISAIIAGYSH
jgi:hypothetical protein